LFFFFLYAPRKREISLSPGISEPGSMLGARLRQTQARHRTSQNDACGRAASWVKLSRHEKQSSFE
jgi:hypothetical protein